MSKTYLKCNHPDRIFGLLLNLHRLEDPFLEFNELKARWVNEKSWVYRTSFDGPVTPEGSTIDLVFEGLDTFATVRLNGETILHSDNMFLAHRVNVTKRIKTEGQNTLEVEFDCAQRRAQEIKNEHPEHKWVGFNGDMARLAARKAQYHWGWDWGPVIMTAGLWRPVKLEVYKTRIADLWPQTKLSDDHSLAELLAVVKIDTNGLPDYEAKFTLSLDGEVIASQGVPVSDNNDAQVSFRVNRPKLWWPHGYGDQSLYEVSVSLMKGEQVVDSKSKKFGIRTAEVIQKVDKHGKSFFFRINGRDIFCGGSCWIPADSLLTNITPERYRRWIELMVEGRQVMIRYVLIEVALIDSNKSLF